MTVEDNDSAEANDHWHMIIEGIVDIYVAIDVNKHDDQV